MLFVGPDGVGKRTCALDVARALLGNAHPLQSPDAMVLAPGINKETGKPTDISAESVRDMKTWAYQRPLYGAAKIVLIDDAERLSDAAANTLLKVLEEPPEYLYFFLITALPDSLLPTIASRCQELRFAVVSDAHMDEALASLSLTGAHKKLLRIVAQGRPGCARTYVNEGRLGEVDQALEQFKKILSMGIAERLVLAKTLVDGEVLDHVVAWWLSWVHSQVDVRSDLAPVARGLLDLSAALQESKYNQRLALDRFLLEVPVISW
jgi:DNA polymerase-3 subunit delta'